MNKKLVRACADEVAWFTARLNRRAEDLRTMDPKSEEFRDAVLVAGYLAQEIANALRKLRRKGSVGRR
jgi:hypothetical protein